MPSAIPAALLRELSGLLPDGALIADPAGCEPFECDALTMYKRSPDCVALPRTAEQVAATLAACHASGTPVVTRGAGTGLSGGALPVKGAVLMVTSAMDSIVHIDPLTRTARVQPGVRNLAISDAASKYGLFYAPDPSSQVACTIGGNVAENSGGVRCLKYGLTLHNVLSLSCLAPDGEPFEVGGPADTGYDLLALLHGSEGMLAVVVEVVVSLTPKPEAAATMLCAFDSAADGGNAVAAIISAGIVPAGLEMMDGIAIEVVDEYLNLGYPKDAKLMMICETDGLREEAEAQMGKVRRVCEEHNARDVRVAAGDEERELMWKGRKSALPAVGRRASDYYCMDGTIPRKRLGDVLEQIGAMSEKYGLGCANVFHAGDGNLHPLIMFHAGDPDEAERARRFGSDILQACLEAGGSVTGEHGVGIEKLNEMCLQFDSSELEAFARVKQAFDPAGALNPGKAIPTLSRCAEFGAMHVQGGNLPHPELERF